MEGGPSIPVCFKLIREMRLGASGQLDFIRRIIFNYLIGNGDAHAKNTSVLYHGKTGTLAPVYDLLSTEIYPMLSHESAMAIGKDCEFSQITRKSFEQMALDCQIRPGAVLDQIDKLVSVTLKHAPSFSKRLECEIPIACLCGNSSRNRKTIDAPCCKRLNAHNRAGKPRHRVLHSLPCADADFAPVRGGGTPERVCGRDRNIGSL